MVDPGGRLKRPYRWAVLFAFVLAVGVTQMVWLNFAPLLGLVQKRYGVSEFLASGLVLVFPLIYVFFSLPAGAMVDKRGYRFTVGLGAVATALFAGLRIWDGSFWMIMAGQVGMAVAQPFVVNGISKLVADWFDEAQGAIATGLGTMGMFLGMALGMATTPALEEAVGLRWTMVVFFGISAAAAAFFVVVAKPNSPGPVTPLTSAAPGGFGPLLRSRSLLIFYGVAFLGLGTFNGLSTWLEEILAPQGINAVDAGLVGGVLIVGGIVGAVIVPLLSDALRRRKPFLVLCALAATVCVAPLCLQHSVALAMGVGAALGFFFMPAFALMLDMSSQVAGAERAGAATSVLMLFGNAGGVLVILAVPLIKNATGGFGASIAMMVALMVVAVVLTVLAPETFGTKPEGA
jgi:predicted MFS family arabinose efflux permease